MDTQDYIKLGLNGDAPLKLILCGGIEQGADTEKIGVVSVVYATMDKMLAEQKLQEFMKANSGNYYMVYSVPLDVDLTTIGHFPSIAITKNDLDT